MNKTIQGVVKEKLGKESSGHDYLHAMRVVNNAISIASDYDVDLDVVKTAALIHDLIDHKLESKYKLSLIEIEALLEKSDFTENQIKMIKDIIENVSFSKGNIPSSLEGKIVQDADRLDALGAIGIARTFAYGGKNNRLLYGDEKREDSLSHFYDKLFKLDNLMNTKKAKEIALERIQFMREFEQRMLNEIK